jgi:prephenate dehydrogenase
MKIVIVGLGVIGGSFAMALQKTGAHEVFGIDSNDETLAKAYSLGLIKNTGNDPGSLGSADIVILCVYPKAVIDFLRVHRNDFKPGCVITDVAGIKRAIAEHAGRLLPDNVDFIPGHPIAGREKMGITYASDAVFKGANYLLTPLPGNREPNIALIETLALEIGFRRVSRISPEAHDEIIAHTSQLPHAMAVALINSNRDGRATGLCIGDSYRDLTRVAKINAVLWSELFMSNSECLLSAVEDFKAQLDLIADAVRAGDAPALEQLFRRAAARREQLDE